MVVISIASISCQALMSTQNAQNWIALGGVLVSVATLIALIVYVCATRGIERETIKQSEASRDLADWQRKQWELDSRKQEWRELIGTLTECFQKIDIEFATPVPNVSAQHIREWETHQMEALSVRHRAKRVIDDRLFITDVLERENVLKGWEDIEISSTHGAGSSVSVTGLRQKWTAFHRKLVTAAQLDLGIDSAGDQRPR